MHFHKWSQWSKLVTAYSGTYQYKYCETCNKITWRRTGCINDFNLVMWNHEPEQKDSQK